MLRRLNEWFNTKDKLVSAKRAPRAFLEPADLQAFMVHFPIGSRVFYFPEQRREMRLETVLLGYAVNRRSVFSAGALRIGEEGVVLVDEEGNRETLGIIDDFYFLIPYQERSEVDLVDKWWERGPDAPGATAINDFVAGNVVTLFARRGPQGMPKIETTVRRTALLKKGLYANTRVVMLRPEPELFGYVDRRHDQRIATRIPTVVKTSRDGPTVRALIDEFSEGHICISPQPGDEILPGLATGQKVVFAIENPGDDRRFVLRGTLLRRRKARLVLHLDGILKLERFHSLEPIDLLEIKAALLNHPSVCVPADAP